MRLMERLPADTRLLRQHCHLGQRLNHRAEEQVVAELDGPGDLASTDVTRAGPEDVKVGPGLGGRIWRAGYREGEPAGLRNARVAAGPPGLGVRR